jgi:BUD22
VKSIASHPAFPTDVKTEKKTPDPATANVTAQLYNSVPVKKAVDELLRNVKRVLKIQENGDVPQNPSKKQKTQPEPLEELSDRDHREDEEQPFEGFSDLSEAEQEDAIASISSRIAASSNSSAEESDSDASDAPSNSSFPLTRTKGRSISRSPTPPPGPPKTKSTAKAKDASDSSRFLPSLSMGGYLSGSESEPEDLDDVAPLRKNRRGQQARRAIWEKKYGAGARHLQNGNKKETRDSGWDMKRGATTKDDVAPWKRKFQKHGPVGVEGVNAVPVRKMRQLGAGNSDKKKEMNDRPIHPSWAAKQKMKASQTPAAVFQGRKITFD